MNSFHQALREIHIAIRKWRLNHRRVKELSSYLVNGVYINSLSGDCVFLRNSSPRIGTITFSSKESLTRLARVVIYLYNKIACHIVRGDYSGKLFHATEIIISSSQTEVKLFDYDSNLVLTRHKSPQRLMELEKNKNFFTKFFSVPLTLNINLEKICLVEEYIPHINYDIEIAFNHLCELLMNYLSAYDNECSINRDYETQKGIFSKRFGNSPLLNEPEGSIMKQTHGDLWSSNVFFDGQRYYITDFERVGRRFFLFDFFFFIFSEYQLNKNIKLVNNFFSGMYDDYLMRLFHTMGLTYAINKRPCYFLAFLVSLVYERWQHYYEQDTLIRELINTYIPEYRQND